VHRQYEQAEEEHADAKTDEAEVVLPFPLLFEALEQLMVTLAKKRINNFGFKSLNKATMMIN